MSILPQLLLRMITQHQPVTTLAQALQIKNLYFKREDTHPFGSHKGRAIPPMIDAHINRGIRHFVISSSGNAALAAIFAIQAYNAAHTEQISLEIYIGEHIDADKKAMLENTITDPAIMLVQVARPKQTAFQQAKNPHTIYLRQSTDPFALTGYFELAEELLQIPDLCAVFVPTSSGTTAQALGEYFLAHKKNIQIHVVQTTACNPIAKKYDTSVPETKTSIAHAIVDTIAHRKKLVQAVIEQTNGNATIITDKEISHAIDITQSTEQITLSANSALSVAGLIKELQNDTVCDGAIACLITGK